MIPEAGAAAVLCGGCGTEIAPGLRVCPGCHRLVFGTELRALAERAAAAAQAGNAAEELAAWRASLDLLPGESRQFAAISERVQTLSRACEAAPALDSRPPTTGAWKWIAGLGPFGLLLWKFKFVVVLLLTKGKFLLLGLTKGSTFFSMLLSLGVYWTAWGLPFAAGFVLSIYIHEMGHVAALRRYGIAATAPMFIPGFGALLRLRQAPANPREDARVGLAGPLWGLGAALAAYAVARLGGGGLWTAIAHVGAWINLFNLMPFWQLDGSRGFSALTRQERWLAVLALGVAWVIARDGVVFLVLLVAAFRALRGPAPLERDTGALLRYATIAVALAVVFRAAA